MHEYDYETAVEWTEWEAKLDRARPVQYKAGDISWAEDLMDEAIDLIFGDSAQIRAAVAAAVTAKVRSVEKRATTRANVLLREIARTGEMPLDWMDYCDLPLSIDGERFKLGFCTPESFTAWELHERRQAAADFTARNEACDGAQLISGWMIAKGVLHFRDLGA